MLSRYFYLLVLAIALFSGLMGCSEEGSNERPADVLLIDKVGRLESITESVERQLANIRNSYNIEVVLAVIPGSEENETIRDMSSRLFTQWDVGRNYGGRGLLLLLVDEDKEIRVEVGSSLEGIFTDLFTGYIEQKQLKSYYLSNQLETGLIAVLEEIEVRGDLMAREEASPDSIQRLDLKFLSAGGGADVDLNEYKEEPPSEMGLEYPAAPTPRAGMADTYPELAG